jgi:uncharacterized protein YjlB
VRTTDYGSVGTLFAGAGLEVVWVEKRGEEIDPDWFSRPTPDLLLVVQGQLRVEFADAGTSDATMEPGAALILPAGTRRRQPKRAEHARASAAIPRASAAIRCRAR